MLLLFPSQKKKHSQTVLKNDESGIMIELKVFVSPELISYILGVIDKIQDIQPESLNELVYSMMQSALLRFPTTDK